MNETAQLVSQVLLSALEATCYRHPEMLTPCNALICAEKQRGMLAISESERDASVLDLNGFDIRFFSPEVSFQKRDRTWTRTGEWWRQWKVHPGPLQADWGPSFFLPRSESFECRAESGGWFSLLKLRVEWLRVPFLMRCTWSLKLERSPITFVIFGKGVWQDYTFTPYFSHFCKPGWTHSHRLIISLQQRYSSNFQFPIWARCKPASTPASIWSWVTVELEIPNRQIITLHGVTWTQNAKLKGWRWKAHNFSSRIDKGAFALLCAGPVVFGATSRTRFTAKTCWTYPHSVHGWWSAVSHCCGHSEDFVTFLR